MRLLRKLLGYIHDGFNLSPDDKPAIIINHANATLQFEVNGSFLIATMDNVEVINISLTGLTINNVFNQLTPLFPDTVISTDYSNYPAQVLLESVRLFDASTGLFEHTIPVYRSMLFVILDMFSIVLETAKADIVEMLKQLYFHSSQSNWLDYYGEYFGIPRKRARNEIFDSTGRIIVDSLNYWILGSGLSGYETDDVYRARIIYETIRAKSNNVALEILIFEKFGLELEMIDSELNPTWFKYPVVFDIFSDSILDDFFERLTAFVNIFKSAGTRFEVELSGGDTVDNVYMPHSDGFVSDLIVHHYANGIYHANGAIHAASHITDIGTVSDSLVLTIETQHYANGIYHANGAIYASSSLTVESL